MAARRGRGRLEMGGMFTSIHVASSVPIISAHEGWVRGRQRSGWPRRRGQANRAELKLVLAVVVILVGVGTAFGMLKSEVSRNTTALEKKADVVMVMQMQDRLERIEDKLDRLLDR